MYSIYIMPPTFIKELKWSLVGIGLVCLYLVFIVIRFNQTSTSVYPIAQSSLNQNSAGPIVLNQQTIAQHNTPQDCWIVIDKNVYAVTDYLSIHPGGVSGIAARCGQDATQAFDSKGGIGKIHSAVAKALLSKLMLGKVGEIVSNQTIDNSLQTIQQDKISGQFGGNDGEEDEREDDD